MKYFLIMALFFMSMHASAMQSQFSVVDQTIFSATGTSAKALDADPRREYLLIQNQGTDSIILHFGSAASTGVIVNANGNYEPEKAPRDAVYIKAASGTQNVLIIDGE